MAEHPQTHQKLQVMNHVNLQSFPLVIHTVTMFQAERATPTEFRDSEGYDLIGACCALERGTADSWLDSEIGTCQHNEWDTIPRIGYPWISFIGSMDFLHHHQDPLCSIWSVFHQETCGLRDFLPFVCRFCGKKFCFLVALQRLFFEIQINLTSQSPRTI